MSERTPRMRMFAGPNGSGKSVLKSYLPPGLLGFYVNADEMETVLAQTGIFDLEAFEIRSTEEEIKRGFADSDFLKREGLSQAAERIAISEGRYLDFTQVPINSYFASVLSDFIRQKLLEAKATFTFETVMSHPGKVDLLAQAQRAGYRTYLYYVATDDPEINVSRVRNRVLLGGHPVPPDKVLSRYYRSLDLLFAAIQNTNRAFIFDNSSNNPSRKQTWLAEITDGQVLEMKSDQVPAWFKRAVLEKAAKAGSS